jgi:SagB-type dehydrogenase family enzyme
MPSVPRNRHLARSPHIVCYWQDEGFILHDFASGARFRAAPVTCDLLDFFGGGRSLAELYAARPHYSRASLRSGVRQLLRHGLLHLRNGREKKSPMAVWELWNPAAGFFHFSTKDQPYADQPDETRLELRRLARTEPMPAAVKRYPRARTFGLPPPQEQGEFARVLLERRSWRRFGRDQIALGTLSTLLSLTARVRWWAELPGLGKVAMKTSPSGGARHPLECYVVARRVRGLPAGIYHYAADVHRLERVRAGVTAREIAAWVPAQRHYGSAAALFVFTAVFRRSQWKYRTARAYRIVLLDAGHMGQTFCLVATALGLAPFCSTALADSRIERALGIDGVSESVLHLAGVGTRPPGVDWAPLPSGRGMRRRENPL